MHLMLEMAFVKVLGSLSQSKVNVRPEDNTTEWGLEAGMTTPLFTPLYAWSISITSSVK
jgi:hypothetical protein